MPDEKFFYNLGARDMLASILAETKDKVKLPEQAEYYEKTFGEKHFSHNWHTSK